MLSYPLKLLLQYGRGLLMTEKLRPKKVGNNIALFKQGICGNTKIVSTISLKVTNSNIKVFELADGKPSKHFTELMFKFSNLSLKLKKEFYIPGEATSIHFLNSKLCLGCVKGFEIIELSSLKTQRILSLKRVIRSN